MEKEFVPYIPSLELKELGFDEPCFAYYSPKGMFIDMKVFKQIGFDISAPLYQQAFRWFREKYYIHCEISDTTDCEEDNESWNFIVYKYKFGDNDAMKKSITDYKTYEEAELACLQQLIQIVKDEKHTHTTN